MCLKRKLLKKLKKDMAIMAVMTVIKWVKMNNVKYKLVANKLN